MLKTIIFKIYYNHKTCNRIVCICKTYFKITFLDAIWEVIYTVIPHVIIKISQKNVYVD